MSMADIQQSPGTPSYAHAANATASIRSPPYTLATGATTNSPSQAPALAGEPPVSPSITSSADDSRISGAVSPAISLPENGLAPMINAPDDLDESVVEALRKPGDRLQVLKFADTMENLINERSPPKRISELLPQEPVSLPTFKIMRRSTPEQRNKGRNSSIPTPSPISATDSTPSLDNSGSSETGSGSPPGVQSVHAAVPEGGADDEILRGLGLPQKQSRTTTGSSTPRKTLQERQAEYEMARSRIFSDLDQREKEAAKLREDQEREREVRELHRQLAEEEDTAGELIRNQLYVGGSYLNGAGPAQDNQLRMVGGSVKTPNRDQIKPVPTASSRAAAAPTPSPAPSTDSEVAPLVSYPTLYDPDGTAYDGGSSNPPYQMDPATASTPYDTNPHPAYLQGPPQGPHAPYGGNPYPAYPAVGMPNVPSHLNGGHPMMMTHMGSYQSYHGMQPNQQLPPAPHGQMPPTNGMNMAPYPMYNQPPANGWGDQRQPPPPGPYPTQTGADANQSPTDQPYGTYPRSMQQNPYWQPPHPQMGNPEMPPPPPPAGRAPYPMAQPNVQPSGHNYMPPPPPPFFNAGMQQHQGPYAPQQGQQPFPPPPPQHAQQYLPQYHPNQQQQRPGPVPQQQQQRQLWNPGAQIGGKRNMFNGPPRPPQQQHQHHNRPPGRDGGQQRPGPSRGPSIREMRENKDYNGPASLIATPMSPPASLRSRSRTSSISERSVSRGPTLQLGQGLWPSGGPEGLSPMSMRGGRQEPNGRPNGVDMGDRKRSGSLSGSVTESVSESGAVTPLDETASLASSTMSSASSTRTFTSTSSKHPSLPSRPDFPQGLPMHRMYSTGSNASRSSHGSVRGKSASSSTSHSRTQSFQSQGRPSPYAPAQADFPPLPGVVNGIGQLQAIPQPSGSRTNSVWTGNARFMIGSSIPEPSQDLARQPQHNRFEEQDHKFTRPPPKPSVALYDPKNPALGKAGPQALVTGTGIAGENEARGSTMPQQGGSVDQSTLLAAKLEHLAVGEHAAGSDVSAP
ncbi:hypothetical protein FRC04_005522 [Tulasnella sp. 424]|nr:hypothetical protein FRC04_005522 [Tulasnella sp. 424]KAG8970635.1 hypothetical protein FRC05_000493 [Tulasnella sp. 425]